MLANALLCPDLKNAPSLQRCNVLSGYATSRSAVGDLKEKPKQAAVNSLVTLLLRLGATVATFSHSRDELEHVITGAAQNIESPDRTWSHRDGRAPKRNDQIGLACLGGPDRRQAQRGSIDELNTPRISRIFRLTRRHSRKSSMTKYRTSILAPRNTTSTLFAASTCSGRACHRKLSNGRGLFLSQAILGSSRAAFQYGQRHEASREVSSVITDFSLANMAWLKAPLGAPAVPMTELLAFSYAATSTIDGNYLRST